MSPLVRWFACALFTLTTCGPRQDRAPDHAALGGDVVGRVGDVDLPVSLVASVAGGRRITPRAALSLLIEDAVASKAAVARGLNQGADIDFATTAALARATVDRTHAEVHRTPPSDDEIKAMSALHWLTVDAPEGLVVVHAVALRPEKPDAQAEAAAKDVASAIASAVASAYDADDFQEIARQVPHGKQVNVVVQPLDPFTADGRAMVEGGGGTYDARFAAAAGTLAVGATSGVVESSFGWHVIRMVSRIPARHVPIEQRRALFTEEIYAKRASEAVTAIQSVGARREPVNLANGVDELLAEALPAIRGQDSAAAGVR